jgi:hypothetical protein
MISHKMVFGYCQRMPALCVLLEIARFDKAHSGTSFLNVTSARLDYSNFFQFKKALFHI